MIYTNVKRECKHCNLIFENIRNVDFANHQRWCHSNPNRKETTKNFGKALSEKSKTLRSIKYGNFCDFTVKCDKCGSSLIVTEEEKLFPKKKKYFCSRKCANSKIVTEETKSKISNSLMHSDKFWAALKTRKLNPLKSIKSVCPECGTNIYVRRKFCCDECKNIAKRRNWSDHKKYWKDCEFKFNLSDYKDKFDFGLIKKFGWYRPANSKNPNLNGVSRDHVMSISYGFKNGIDSKIISHPANCRLLRHSENLKKNFKSDITLEELLFKIEQWGIGDRR